MMRVRLRNAALMKVAGALICATILVTSPALAQDDCRTSCLPDEVSGPNGCCTVVEQRSGDVMVDEASGCPPGRNRTPSADGSEGAAGCCFEGQQWRDARCVGVPSACPTGFRIATEEESCVLVECRAGQTRADDGVSCCYPGQTAVEGVCRGVPSSCPEGFRPAEARDGSDGETCIDTRVTVSFQRA